MKKFLYFLIISLVLFTISQSYSQNFKAKAGLDKARSSSEISNPELLLCATYNGTIQGIPTSFVFDMNSGEANVWFYYFRSADDNNIKKLMLCTYILGFVSWEIPVTSIIDSLPFTPAGSLNDVQWIDSDVMAQNLRNNQNYQNYKTAHSDAAISLVTLSYNGDYPYVPIGSAYWIAKIDALNTTSLICAINAVSGDVICFDEPSAVEDSELSNSELKIYPNPAKDNLFILLPDGLLEFGNELQIFDTRGKLIYTFNVRPVEGIYVISIPLNIFLKGTYFIKIKSKQEILSGKFMIDK